MDTLTAPAHPPAGTMPSPERIMSTLGGHIDTAALKAAIELELFTAIADGATTAAEIANRIDASERGVRILSDYLTIQGFLTKEGHHYGLTPDSATFLNGHSPTYLGSIANFLASDYMLDEFRDLAENVRRGGSQDAGTIEPENPIWIEFAKSMAPMMMMPAHMIAGILLHGDQRPMKVLDIAAGHGVYGIVIAQKNPNAKVVGVDWRNVLELARENAAKFGVADRYDTIAGSAFEVDFGSDYDLVLLPNFLHHFDIETNVTLLRKVHAALKPGGQVAIVEFVPNEDRVTPPFSASFSMMMLAGTPSGDAYTYAELERMLTTSGFRATTRHDLLPSPQTLLISVA